MMYVTVPSTGEVVECDDYDVMCAILAEFLGDGVPFRVSFDRAEAFPPPGIPNARGVWT